jgi:hypothetical protein
MLLTFNTLALKKMLLNVFFTTFSMVVNQQAADTCFEKAEPTIPLKVNKLDQRINLKPKAPTGDLGFEGLIYFFNGSNKAIPKRGCLRSGRK